jgi:raffinose/stachyose/melibiose transport system permease protein
MARPITFKKAMKEWRLYLFLVPSFAMIATFEYFPAATAIYHSFFRWDGGTVEQYIGTDNFSNALHDATLWAAFGTVFILIVANLFKMIPSILVAVLIHRLRSDSAQYRYRVMFVVPMIIPGLVMLLIWKFFYDANFGILNQLLDVTHLKGALVWLDANVLGWKVFSNVVPIQWLSEPKLVLPSLIFWGFPWIGVVGVLIYLAGLQAISRDVYEAADLDGIGPVKLFWYIELPLIMTQIRLNLILMVIGTLQSYGLILVLLGPTGGPGGAAMVPGLWMFNKAFVEQDYGYACALGLILFVFILILTLINNRFVRVEK